MRAGSIIRKKFFINNSTDEDYSEQYNSYYSKDKEDLIKRVQNLIKKSRNRKEMNKNISSSQRINQKKFFIFRPINISHKFINKRYNNIIAPQFKSFKSPKTHINLTKAPYGHNYPNYSDCRELLINSCEIISPLETISYNNYKTINENYYNTYKKPTKSRKMYFYTKNNSNTLSLRYSPKKINTIQTSPESINQKLERFKTIRAKYANIYNEKRLRSNSSNKPYSTNTYNNSIDSFEIQKNIDLSFKSNSRSRKKKKYYRKLLPSINLSKDNDNYSNENNKNYNINKNKKNKKFIEDMFNKTVYDKNLLNNQSMNKKEIYNVYNVKNIVTPDKRIFLNIKYFSIYSQNDINTRKQFHKRRIGPEDNINYFDIKKFNICDKINVYCPSIKINKKEKLGIISEEKNSKENVIKGIGLIEKFFKKNKCYYIKKINKINNKKKIKFKMREKKLDIKLNNEGNERYFLFSNLNLDSFDNKDNYNQYIDKKKEIIDKIILSIRLGLIKSVLRK